MRLTVGVVLRSATSRFEKFGDDEKEVKGRSFGDWGSVRLTILKVA